MNPTKSYPETSIVWELPAPCKADEITQCPDQGSTSQQPQGSFWMGQSCGVPWPRPSKGNAHPWPLLQRQHPQGVLFCTSPSPVQLIAKEADPLRANSQAGQRPLMCPRTKKGGWWRQLDFCLRKQNWEMPRR